MSHTVKIKVEMRDRLMLEKVITQVRGTVLGDGVHRLYQGQEQGFGFNLPDWKYPIVLKENGELAFDDYNGSWGDRKNIDSLKERYAIEAAKAAAEAQGWLTESITGGGLLIYHPDGGTLTVKPDGSVDAENFVGTGCLGASATIENAMGTRQSQSIKLDMFAERARIREVE
jgi:hypothetical protein